MTAAPLERASSFPVAIRHGFSTRCGGVSVGQYDSLNLGGKWGDDPRCVAENLRRVGRAGSFDVERLVRVRQVHGADVIGLSEVTATAQADGLWMHRDEAGDRVIGVLTADCVPVLLVDREATVVAAVHSGWRGTVAGIVGEAVRGLVERANVRVKDLLAAIGPCIERDAFEVGDEVAEQFEPAFVRRQTGRRPHVDLVACVRAQLVDAGLDPRAISRVGACTHANPKRYFSYRRDGQTGQHLSFIGFEPREKQPR